MTRLGWLLAHVRVGSWLIFEAGRGTLVQVRRLVTEHQAVVPLGISEHKEPMCGRESSGQCRRIATEPEEYRLEDARVEHSNAAQ